MAPRTAKAKKTADVKLSENDVPKKGRGKGKNINEPDEGIDEIEEKVVVTEKKNKRGKNIVNYNEDKDEVVPPVKKGRKKNVETVVNEEPVSNEVASLNGDNSAEDGVATPADDLEENDDQSESNGHSEKSKAPASKGRKKGTKKDLADNEVKVKETGRGRKNVKQNTEVESKEDDVVEEKPKGRGRARKQAARVEPESEEDEEEAKAPPPSKGKKKQQKITPEKDDDDDNEDLSAENKEESQEEPKKKEIKGRKNANKKGKDVSDEKDVEMKEEPAASKKKRGSKKEDKAKGDVKEDMEEDEDTPPEVKPAKGKRGQKKTAEKSADTEEVQDTGEPTTKRRRKADDKASDDKKKVTKSVTDYESIDFTNNAKNSQGKDWNLKIACWNVDGIRAWMGKGGLDYLKHEKPNILCLQETKCSQDKLPEEAKNVPGYHAYWLCSDKDGYAGVSIYTTKLAMNVQYGLQNEELDTEGRIITAEYEQFYLICTYVPNAGRKLVTLDKRLKWNDEFRKYVKELDKKKPVIICGDMNVAHKEIDLTNPKTNKKNAGFTEEERAGMTDLLGDGFVDAYRHFYPDETGAYTFWSNMFNSRAKNVGWRLDYFIVSERLISALCDSVIRNKVYGSDHCPISLFLHLSTADKPKE